MVDEQKKRGGNMSDEMGRDGMVREQRLVRRFESP